MGSGRWCSEGVFGGWVGKVWYLLWVETRRAGLCAEDGFVLRRRRRLLAEGVLASSSEGPSYGDGPS